MWFNSLFPCIGQYGKSSKKNLAKYENNLEWQNTFINLINIATYTFEWENLPDTCNERFLELALLTNGMACLVNDEELGYLSLFANPYYNINIYGQFTEIRGVGWNGFNRSYKSYLEGGDNTDAKAVLCRDNNMMYPYLFYIIRATDRLMSAMRSIDVASKKLKNPYFINCDETQQLSIKKIIDDIDRNEEAIITSKSTMPESFKIFPTNMDVSTLKVLWEHYNNLDSQIRTILGIDNNAQSAKRERLITDEININNEYTNLNIDMRLHQRELFCDYCNETFGLNISVKKREMFSKYDNNIENDNIGRDENESVDNSESVDS